MNEKNWIEGAEFTDAGPGGLSAVSWSPCRRAAEGAGDAGHRQAAGEGAGRRAGAGGAVAAAAGADAGAAAFLSLAQLPFAGKGLQVGQPLEQVLPAEVRQ
jgi:hypothetical protein